MSLNVISNYAANVAHRYLVQSDQDASQSLAKLSILPKLDLQALARLDTSDLHRLDIAMPPGPGILCLPLPPCSTSASDIRQRIRRGTTPVNELPTPVESYILQHHLYQEDRNRTNS